MFKLKFILLILLLSRYSLFAQTPINYGENITNGAYIQLNGVKHYYETYGEGNPLLLIHGNGTGISGWAAQIAYFSRSYKVYAIDCRGRGKSELGKDSLSYIQQAKDMTSFIKQLNLQNVMVVGKSDGGIIALMMGIYYPQNIQKIVCFGTNISPDTNALYPSIVADIKASRAKAERMISYKDTSFNWKLIYQRFRMMEFQPNITTEELGKIQVPVLVISCDRDVIKEEHTLMIYKHIPMANLAILPGETHQVPRLNPELFNKTIERFLSRPFKGFNTRFNN